VDRKSGEFILTTMKKVFLAVYDKKANTRNENPEINLQKM
jgi:hypothetical protein